MIGYIRRLRISDIIGCFILKFVFIYWIKVIENKFCIGYWYVYVLRNLCFDECLELNFVFIVFRLLNWLLKYEIYLCCLNNLLCLLMVFVWNLLIVVVVLLVDDFDIIFERWLVG